MNKKSFLRGFGAGVLFVTVILGISCLIRTSDSAVITRAKKLGMTFASSNNTIYDNTKTASGSSILGNENNTKIIPTQKVHLYQLQTHLTKRKRTKLLKKKKEDGEEYKRGKEKAHNKQRRLGKKVADNLEDEGIISDSGKFVDYMKENDYASKIRPGEYEFSIDDDFSDIAKTITKQNKWRIL